MKNKKIFKVIGIIIGVLVLLFIIGKIIISSVASKFNNITESEISVNFDEHIVTVENLTSVVKGTGEITSFNIQTLDVSSYSQVKEDYVNDGDIVTKNQKILKINSEGYISDVKAPISGMFFKTDDIENPYVIYDIDNIGIEIYVTENDVVKMSVGQKAIVKISALNKEVEGEVAYVSKLPIDGKFKVRVKIEYFEELRFGYGASVKINISEKENVMVIPYQALYMDNNEKYYVIKKEYRDEYYNNFMNDATELADEYKTFVKVGTITNNKVEILSGLTVGDKIYEWNW